MTYHTIRIQPVGIGKKRRWSVMVQESCGIECVKQKTEPRIVCDTGFYYYPRTMKSEKAFDILLDHMVKAHEGMIDRTQRSLNELKKLKLD